MTLKNEERDVVTVSIRPGMVDTDMQTELRDKHHSTMDEEDRNKFFEAKREGKLLRPEQPGNVIAKLALNASLELSGKFLRYVDHRLRDLRSLTRAAGMRKY